MQRQSSTAISDLVLALSSLWGFRAVAQAEGGTGGEVDHRFAKWWFMLVTLAASLGVIRFGALMPNHQGTVERYHNNFSWLSRAIGIPCLAAEVCAVLDFPVISQGFLLSALGTFMVAAVRSRHKDRLTDMVATLAVLAISLLSFSGGREVLAMGGVLVGAGGLVMMQGTGPLLGLPRVDVFHYCLAAANYCIGRAIVQ